MERQITHGHNVTAEEAVAEFEALGLYTAVVNVPAADNDFHWHDFDSIFYILEGGLEVTDHESGEKINLVTGDRVQTTRGFAHRERHDGFTGVFGISVDPATLEFPLEKPLPVPA